MGEVSPLGWVQIHSQGRNRHSVWQWIFILSLHAEQYFVNRPSKNFLGPRAPKRAWEPLPWARHTQWRESFGESSELNIYEGHLIPCPTSRWLSAILLILTQALPLFSFIDSFPLDLFPSFLLKNQWAVVFQFPRVTCCPGKTKAEVWDELTPGGGISQGQR